MANRIRMGRCTEYQTQQRKTWQAPSITNLVQHCRFRIGSTANCAILREVHSQAGTVAPTTAESEEARSLRSLANAVPALPVTPKACNTRRGCPGCGDGIWCCVRAQRTHHLRAQAPGGPRVADPDAAAADGEWQAARARRCTPERPCRH